MPIDIKAIEARCKAASPGPWKWWTSNSWRRLHSDHNASSSEIAYPFVSPSDGHPNFSISEEDMEFIAHAREDMPALLDELKTSTQQHHRWWSLCENRILAGIQDLLAGGYTDMSPTEILEDLQDTIIKAGIHGPPLTPAEEWEAQQAQMWLPGVER